MSNVNNEGGKKMTTVSVRVERELKDKLDKKSGLVPLSIITRELWEKWLKGEVKLDLFRENKEKD